MFNWFHITDSTRPMKGRLVLCYCPEWCNSGYQVAYFDEDQGGFYYDEQPNSQFNDCVEAWSLLGEYE